MRALARSVAVLVLVALAASPARAGDVLALKDGRFIEGVAMTAGKEAVVLHYRNGDVGVPMDLIEDYVIAGAAVPDAGSEESRAQRAQGLVPWHGRWVKPEVRDKGLEAERKKKLAEIADAKAHAEWRNRYQFQTKGFEYESTYTQRLNEEYSAALEQYFDVFRKDWNVKVPRDWGRLKVCFYRDRKQFERTAGGRGGTLAYYQPVPPGGDRAQRTLNCYFDRRDPVLSLHCMFHECSHYMQDLVSDGTFWIPHWVGESMAEYYGSVEWDPAKKTLSVGHVLEDRLVEVRADIDMGKRYGVLALMSAEGAYEDYYWGWSFVHFLMNTPAYQKKFQQFFVELCRSKDVKRTASGDGFTRVEPQECLRLFRKKMGIEDVRPLEDEWYAYIDKLPTDSLRGVEQAGMRAYGEGRWKFRAPRLLKAAIDKGSRNPFVYLDYCRCLRLRPDAAAEALAAAEKACEVDPLEADCWAERGYVLLASGRKDEGQKFVDLAREMNPEDPYLDFDIAAALASSPEGGGK